MFHLPTLYDVAVVLPAVIIGLTVHEYAHALIAYRLGDMTARYQGRMTLNPVAHIDVVGFLMIFLVGFGWAKPVPINPLNFRGEMRKGIMYVSMAGPLANLILAVVASLTMGILIGTGYLYSDYFKDAMVRIIFINVMLAVFNLLPIPPLDGSKILAGILPGRQEWLYALDTYGIVILLLLMFTGVIGKILNLVIIPLANYLLDLAFKIAIFVT